MKSLWNSSEVGTYEILLVQSQVENSAKFESGRFWGGGDHICIYICGRDLSGSCEQHTCLHLQ